ncbi:MAG: DUF1194 domain-containing protein [Salinarimonadaceae bacterium]|nr:MAG: DUF1194 domain-containing protein [Salinarimonadaceae bacterium]
MLRNLLPRRVRAAVASLAFCLALSAASQARAETEVDVALVLAVDISFSMSMEELTLQRDGFVDAFRSREVQNAIENGLTGRIAVTYMEWAGVAGHAVLAPWTVIEDAAGAVAFSAVIEAQPTRRMRRTSISAAIDRSMDLLADSGVFAIREVIDISGDGVNNEGRPVEAARDAALDRGVIINGLPIMIERHGAFDIANLDAYFVDCVIGGPGAFVIPVREPEQFAEAIRRKLVLEIAGITPEPDLVRRADDSSPIDCLIGEKLWMQRRGFTP